MARYSDSAEELETTSCLFDFQEISEFPTNIQKPDTLRRESGQPLQSASANADNFKSELAG